MTAQPLPFFVGETCPIACCSIGGFRVAATEAKRGGGRGGGVRLWWQWQREGLVAEAKGEGAPPQVSPQV